MLDAGVLTFREFAMSEPLPLSTVQGAVLEFLRGRDDAILFGAHAVNAYVDEPRMTQYIDLLSARAPELAQGVRDYLAERFKIAVRVRELGKGRGFRVYQIAKSGNRHLVDIRPTEGLPPAQRIAEVLVAAPAELIAQKVIAYHHRRGQPKAGTDWRDLASLLLAFPDLKCPAGPVADRLHAAGASPKVFDVWKELVAQDIGAPEDDGS